jgi:multiple sugar transport system substrate-binding protein
VVTTEVPFSELVQKYATAIAGGQAPDALSMDLIYNPAFAAAGQLEDLTD